MKKILFAIPVLALAAVLVQNTNFSTQADAANVEATLPQSSASGESIDQPSVNPLTKAPASMKNRFRQKATSKQKAYSAVKSEAFPNRPVSLATREAKIRKEVSSDEVNAVLFQGRPAVTPGKKGGEQTQPAQPAIQDDGSNPANSDAGGRWISRLSGKSAILNVENRKPAECSESRAKCAELAERNEVSVVGIVVKSQADRSSIIPAPMNGQVNFGSQLENTPAVYID
jgi:hypothetical protein